MSDLNRWQGIGRLGRDPETRFTQTGDPVCNFSVAVSEKWKDKAKQTQERTTWVRLVAFGRVAEIVDQYTAKGDRIYVEGRLQERQWEDRDGQKRYSTEIVVQNVQLLGGGKQEKAKPKREPAAAEESFDDELDSLPF